RLKKVAEVACTMSSTEKVAEVAIFNASAFPGAPTFPTRRRGEISARLPVGAKLVVAPALLRIGEDLIGLPDVLKFFFGGFVAGVDVGVILARQLAVGFFNIIRCGGARHPEDFIVVLELDGHSLWSLFCVKEQWTPHCATRTRAGRSTSLPQRYPRL